jgi:hypothetical protein
MSEKRTIQTVKTAYSGLFKVRDFYKLIDDWIIERGYDKNEKMHSESVSETGKDIHLVVEAIKKISEYAKYVIEMEIIMKNVREVIVKRKEKSEKLNQGEVSIELTGWFITDYENKWEQKPMYVFFRSIVDKFIFKTPLSEEKLALVDEVKHLQSQIDGYLNLYRYRK